ncbi:tetratricopeptide repeat protein, partial [Phytoactinopolyspora endophytica]|uniref:tetratricopeptide repeat protein n=1 Tax=Phytoactinopolyspora endophytica TaxID=1642495 RepID=UPI0013EB1CDA
NNIGYAYRELGKTSQARDHHDEAYAICVKSGETFEHARALDGIAAILATEGALDEAKQRWNDALAMFEELGSPEAADVRDRLAQLPAVPHPWSAEASARTTGDSAV